MPELPEVETIRRTLEQLIVGKTVARLSVHLPRIVREPTVDEFKALLEGQTVQTVRRRGKFLQFFFDQWVLVSHLRMEGRYKVVNRCEPVEKHTHVVFHFTDDTELRYRDVRQFGTMQLVRPDEVETKTPVGKLGPEPLSPQFTKKWLEQALQNRKTRLKPLLLNQEFLAGLGNIYVDEALFAARLHPERSADSLTSSEIGRLYRAIQETVREAVRLGGSSVRSYVDGEGEMGMFQLKLNVYGRREMPCPACGNPIVRTVVAGRGTHLCPECQPTPHVQ